MGKIQSEVKVKSKLLANKNAPTFLRVSAKGSFSGDSLSVNMQCKDTKKSNMEDKEYTKYEGCASAVAVILALVVLALVCCSCKTRYITETEYKEVPVVMHDTVSKNIWRIDTTIVKDSVYFAIKGDTIYKERYNTKWRIKVAHDTINKVVEKPVEVVRNSVNTETKEVNRIYWWQKVLMLIGVVWLIGLLVEIYKFGKRK